MAIKKGHKVLILGAQQERFKFSPFIFLIEITVTGMAYCCAGLYYPFSFCHRNLTMELKCPA